MGDKYNKYGHMQIC